MEAEQKGRISVIVPIYNTEAYVSDCLDTLCEQTHKNLEIILVDDGSEDQSLAIAEAYVKKDKRIVLLKQSNQGAAAARNKGLEKATGEYISFVDSDDYIDKDFYERLIGEIGDKDCVQIGYREVRADKTIVSSHLPRHFYQYVSPCMRLYKRAFLEKHNIAFAQGVYYEDVLFSLRFWQHKPTHKIVDYKGYNYVMREGSTTAGRKKEKEKELFEAIERVPAPWWLKIYTILRLKIHFIWKH